MGQHNTGQDPSHLALSGQLDGMVGPQQEMSRHYVTSFDIMQLTKSLIR